MDISLFGGKMVTITPDQITFYGTLGSLILLAIIIYFTRAKSRRIVGAVVGGFVVGLLIILIDWTASSLGLWYYPGSTTGYGPLGYYIPNALFYGAGIAFIGWRINRKWGIKALISFIVIFGLYGIIRDFIFTASTQSSNIIVFGHGIFPVIADMLAWIGALSIAQIIMWLIAGPSKTDSLARESNKKD